MPYGSFAVYTWHLYIVWTTFSCMSSGNGFTHFRFLYVGLFLWRSDDPTMKHCSGSVHGLWWQCHNDVRKRVAIKISVSYKMVYLLYWQFPLVYLQTCMHKPMCVSYISDDMQSTDLFRRKLKTFRRYSSLFTGTKEHADLLCDAPSVCYTVSQKTSHL